MKVRHSEIDNEINKRTKNKVINIDENTDFDDLFPDKEGEDGKKLKRTFLFLEDFNAVINPFLIQSIIKSKNFREHDARWEFGIEINGGVEKGRTVGVSNIAVTYWESEKERDKRFSELIEKLEEVGVNILKA